MPTFDLGDAILVEQVVEASQSQTIKLSARILRSYETMGYQVDITDGAGTANAAAVVHDEHGTKIDVSIAIAPTDYTHCQLRVRLRGAIHVGGMKGMVASESVVRQFAQQQLSVLVERTFEGVRFEALEPEVNEPEVAGEPMTDDRGVHPADSVDANEETGEAATDDKNDGENETTTPRSPPPPKGTSQSYQDTISQIMSDDWSNVSDADKQSAVDNLITLCGVAAGAVTIQPLPLLDAALITPIQIAMVQGIGRIRGHKLDAQSAIEILGSLGTGLVTQTLAMAASKLIPFAGWAVAISMGYALTFAVGRVSDHYFSTGRGASKQELSDMFKQTFEQKKAEKNAANESNLTLKDRLEQLTSAYDAGLLTAEEFAAKKEQLLAKF